MLGFGDKRSSHRYLSYTDHLAVAWQDQLLLVARVIAGWIFLQSGFGKVMDPATFAARLVPRGVPEWLGLIAPFVEFIGGIMLVLGIGARYGALMLIAFTIAATWISHRFWIFPEAQQGQQSTQFWKNVSMIGGLLALFVTGPGRFSLDRWLSRR
ncbi:MAG: putative oxidoreductase [Alphaproteobacteria bacterium]|jgi:putative oxidoreductase|nr:putative oxidoreductase [Alphaproteobacteria bacterium]